MNYYLRLSSGTRINDEWADDSVDWSPMNFRHCDEIIQGGPRSTLYQADFYKYVALDIVAESVYNYPYPQITEKTLRPIACKKLFIIVGSPKTVALLQDYGFDTFNDIIDHSYDNIQDPVKRWMALKNCISNFINTPLDTVKQTMLQIQPRLNNNFEILKNLEQIEIQKLNDSN
jgi:hypothetical protein